MTEPDRLRVAHIVPAMLIGGVEVAIARSHPHLNESVDYRVYYVRQRGSLECSQRHVSSLVRSVLTGSWRPDVVVTSLWWAHPFGRLLRRFGATWIAFFHNCGFTGSVQRLILQSAWRKADSRQPGDRGFLPRHWRARLSNSPLYLPGAGRLSGLAVKEI